jgi:hypothetical protein
LSQAASTLTLGNVSQLLMKGLAVASVLQYDAVDPPLHFRLKMLANGVVEILLLTFLMQ